MTVEFVNREVAEREAARAVSLFHRSNEAKVEAWFAMQAVADQVGPASNLGVRGVCWDGAQRGRPSYYKLQSTCVQGRLSARMAAPASLAEAKEPERLAVVVATLSRKVAEMGGLSRPDMRPANTSAALIEAVSATAEGAMWVASSKRLDATLRTMVRIADKYGREGVNPEAGINAHMAFLTFEDRVALVRDFPSGPSARAKAMTLRADKGDVLGPPTSVAVPSSKVADLAIRSGVSRSEARAILRAVLDGRSQMRLIRAVKEAVKMAEVMESGRRKAA